MTTAVGILVFLLALVPLCPCAEPSCSAEAHDCCAPPPGLRAADDSCGSSLRDAAPVASVASPPPPPAVAEKSTRSAVTAVSVALSVGLPRPSSSAPPILRI